MFKIIKIVCRSERFSPLVGSLIVRRSQCCLTKNIYPTATYAFNCCKKRSTIIPEGKRCAPWVTVAQRSTMQDDNILVYHGNLTSQIRLVKIFSLCSSVTGLVAQPILYKHASELGGTGMIIAVASFVGFFTFVTPVLLHLITKKYVTDIHHNDKTDVYTASLLTFFLRVKKVSFLAEEVIVPDVPGLLTTFKVKGVSLFVDPKLFGNPYHYGKLMGYDKPMDFLLKKDISSDDNEESEIKDSKK